MTGRGRPRTRKPAPPRPVTQPCAWCGRAMYPGQRTGRKKYCSLRCKQAAYRARLKQTKQTER